MRNRYLAPVRTRFRVVGFFLLAMAWFVADTRAVDAGWLIYHKPEFKGKIVDSETSQPIEGAIVVAMYTKNVYYILASRNVAFHFKEVVTGKDGTFRIPAYTTLINPIAWDGGVFFVVYKSGYGALTDVVLEDSLVGDPPKKIWPDMYWSYPKNKKAIFKFQPGVIGLPKLDSPYERKDNAYTLPSTLPRNAAPMLYQAVDEDRRRN